MLSRCTQICLMGQLVHLESDLPAQVAPEVIYPLIMVEEVDRRDSRLILQLVILV